jgi:UDP-N-acetylmuramyl pentapeptide phosphotransferase/UDP-N-acetylglucosamine-1-phosphate transferase
MKDAATFWLLALVVPLAAAALSAAALHLSLPWLRSIALAVPDGRSLHREPTPQGGGVAVVASALLTTWVVASAVGAFSGTELQQYAMATVAALLLAIVGFVDDVRGLSPLKRLLAQFLAVGIVIAAVPSDLRIIAELPWWLERLCIFLAGVWFVNLVNFMDGIDWITVAEVVPVTGAIAVIGVMGVVPPLPMLVALALMGAMLGFAPFNKPVARLFLGDAGSLPIGLLLGWLLLILAANGHLAAALLLPLYYLADATLTLFRRLARGERPWVPHKTHFYQRARDRGFTVHAIVGRVFAVNVALAALALIAVATADPLVSVAALAAGAVLVGLVLRRFAGGRPAA